MDIFFVSFKGQKTLGPRPDRSPLGVSFKISDEHPHPIHMRSPPGDIRLHEFLYGPIDHSTLNIDCNSNLKKSDE